MPGDRRAPVMPDDECLLLAQRPDQTDDTETRVDQRTQVPACEPGMSDRGDVWLISHQETWQPRHLHRQPDSTQMLRLCKVSPSQRAAGPRIEP